MTPNPISIMTAFFGILFLLILMLLPSIIELKKPKDPGPKIIREYDFIYLHDLDVKKAYEENGLKAHTLIPGDVVAILALLPDLEAS